MKKKHKILNDPVYGFVSIPYGIIFDLIEHPYFQRLRRIKQVSLTHYVYPGALHTRFNHAIGAFHLTQQAIASLRDKGVAINLEEAEAVSIAILLHDIGHGPFSHTLEQTLIHVHHEELSLLFMEKLNEEFDGRLDLAIAIFRDQYHKPFLHQLVSGQLDMDRMDYLNRDSYFTGVSEGVIGYHRLIKMLNVHEGRLVVEEKGLYSIEKFLIARRLMYWQVYLHKTVLSAEIMLIQCIRRAKDLRSQGIPVEAPPSLAYFLNQEVSREDFLKDRDLLLNYFATLDDTDIAAAVKQWQNHSDPILSHLSYGLANRKLFRLSFYDQPLREELLTELRLQLAQHENLPSDGEDYFIISGKETNAAYSTSQDEINILLKDGTVQPISLVSNHGIQSRSFTQYYLCCPKQLTINSEQFNKV